MKSNAWLHGIDVKASPGRGLWMHWERGGVIKSITSGSFFRLVCLLVGVVLNETFYSGLRLYEWTLDARADLVKAWLWFNGLVEHGWTGAFDKAAGLD